MTVHESFECNPHEEYIGLLARAADDSLDAAGRIRLETHLTTCEGCRAALAAQRHAHEILRAWRPAPASADFARRVVAAARPAESWLDGWDYRRWTWRLSPVAAGLALTALLVVTQMDRTVSSTTESGASDPDGAVSASVTLATSDLSEDDAVALLLVADPDESISAALEEISQ
jgi:anti-sigma factor RsiW